MASAPGDPPLFYDRHIFMCTNVRPAGHPRGCCMERAAELGGVEKVRGYASEAGRDPQAIEPGLYFTLAAGDNEAVREGQNFLSQYYNRPYDAVAKAMVCVMGSWDQVMDQIQAYTGAGARTLVLRFAGSDQIRYLEECAKQLARRGFTLAA